MTPPPAQISEIVLVGTEAAFLDSATSAAAELGLIARPSDGTDGALAYAREHDSSLLLCDGRGADSPAFDLLARIRAEAPRCEFILAVAAGQSEAAIRALREGATDILEHPIQAAGLRAALERTRRFRALAEEQQLLSGQVNVLSNALTARTMGQNVMVGQSEAMRRVAQEIMAIADTNATVLVLGESGTGKEVIANAIHQNSGRSKKPMLAVNCSSISESLFESEMFGHRRGAFTGAIETRTGFVEAADGGTLFMDEVGDLPLGSQAKILRLLEQKAYIRVGETEARDADVRIVAATNQPLEELIEKKSFREDLYYRLSVCTVRLPPLRERVEDISLLANYFAHHFAAEMGKPLDGIGDDAMEALEAYPFPGNVRELRNVVENAVIRCRHDGALRRQDIPVGSADATPAPDAEDWPLESYRFHDVERWLYEAALRKTDQNVSATARLLELDRSRLRRRMRALGMD